MKKQIIVIILSLLGALILWAVLPRAFTKYREHSVRQANCREVLNASRKLITKCAVITTEPLALPKAEWPEPIRTLRPWDVFVYSNDVTIVICPFPARLQVLAFAEGITGYGKEKIIEGLWLCNDPCRAAYEATHSSGSSDQGRENGK